MHAGFAREARTLQSAFGSMGSVPAAYVLGDALMGLQWHVFVVQSAAAATWQTPVRLHACLQDAELQPLYAVLRATTEQRRRCSK